MAKLSPVFFQMFDNNGDPLNGGKLYTYNTGTTTNKKTYKDVDGSVENTNPVILDSSGRADVWLESGAYDFILKDSSDSLISQILGISGESANIFGSTLDVTSNTNIGASYNNYIINCNSSNDIILSLLSVSSAGEGFVFSVKNNGTGNVVIDPSSSETIDGQSTITLYPDQSTIITSSVMEWNTIGRDVFALSTDNTFTGNNTFTGKVLYNDKGILTISSGAITVTGANHTIDTEGSASTDDLDTILGGSNGDILYIRAENTARTVVVKHGTGNIQTFDGNDITLDDTNKVIVLIYDSALSKWIITSHQISLPTNTVRVESSDALYTLATDQIPWDDTIPQSNEGKEMLVAPAITPRYSTSILKVRVVFNYAPEGVGTKATIALFRDSGVNAVAVANKTVTYNEQMTQMVIDYEVIAGSTSATTFKLRAGSSGLERLTMNGVLGVRYFGGTLISSITVTEIEQ